MNIEELKAYYQSEKYKLASRLGSLDYFINAGHDDFEEMINHIDESIAEKNADLDRRIEKGIPDDPEFRQLQEEWYAEEAWKNGKIYNSFLNSLLVAEVMHFED